MMGFFVLVLFKTTSSEENGDCNISSYIKTFWCFCSKFALIIFFISFQFHLNIRMYEQKF